MFFSLLAFSLSINLRDIVIGEWDVFPDDSDFTQTSYTIEFHQSSYDPLDQSTLNCTLWKDDSMHSYLPSAFIFSAQGPLAASFQINFNSDYSGSIYNVKTKSFNTDSSLNKQLRADFSFDLKPDNGNKRISKFKIDKYTFIVDFSDYDKENQIMVDVSSAVDDKDSSLISSKSKFIVTRTREFENKQLLRQRQPSKNSKASSNEFSQVHESLDIKISNKIKGFLNEMEIDVSNNYAILIVAALFMLVIFLISKIIAACFFTNEEKKPTKTTTGKKAKKHKKKSSTLENKKEEVKSKDNTENEEVKEKEKDNSNEDESVKVKTD